MRPDDFAAAAVMIALGVLVLRAAREAGGGGPSPHFSWQELRITTTGIPNDPPPAARANLAILARSVLEPLRAAAGGRPITVSSAYRSAAVNAAVGGELDSQHLAGEAADITANHLTAESLAAVARQSGLPYDQLIWYHPTRGGHVHISASPGRAPRREVLYYPEAGRSVLIERAAA